MKNKTFQPVITVFLVSIALICMSFNLDTNKTINDFHLRNVDGRMVSLKDYPKAKGFIIVFTCNHCPFAKLYFQRLNDLNHKFKSQGVPVIAICSSDTVNFEEDVFDKMKIKAASEHINYPYLCDAEQTVAKNFAARKTPHAFVIWKENGNWVVKYNGAIDDNGAEPLKVKNLYVANAVEALLKGREVEVKEIKSIGCSIGFRQK
jgi:peroxiredoxin